VLVIIYNIHTLVVYTIRVLMLIHTNYFSNEFSLDSVFPDIFRINPDNGDLLTPIYMLIRHSILNFYLAYNDRCLPMYIESGARSYKGYAADDVE
jgi:hypothetical protein